MSIRRIGLATTRRENGEPYWTPNLQIAIGSILLRIDPLDRTTNAVWKAKNPGQYLVEKHLSFDSLRRVLAPLFIDAVDSVALERGAAGMKEFWQHRATLMADDLLERVKIRL